MSRQPGFRVSAEEVFATLKQLHEDHDVPAFTTNDVTESLKTVYRGVSHKRIERSVRAGVSWLCEREVAYVAGVVETVTKAGFISKPFVYALYPGRTWNKRQREAVRSSCDTELLNRVFICR